MAEKKFVFEKSVKRIEEIVLTLEKGEVSLDESLTLFQEGADLIKKCSKALDDAEQKLSLLVKTDGEPEMTEFQGGEQA